MLFFRYEKGYIDWTEQEIEDSRNDDDTTEFLEWLVKHSDTSEFEKANLNAYCEKGEEWGNNMFDDLVNFEKRLWNREDYYEEDITLFSWVVDYIEANKKDFEKFVKEKAGE